MAKAHAVEFTFKDGVKIGPGKKRATPVKTKESLSSNGLTKYLTILWSDKVLTCNCQGWAMRKFDKVTKEPVPRTCKHCKACEATKHADMVDVGNTAVAVETPESGRHFRNIRIRARE
jgi:hypothetical protein